MGRPITAGLGEIIYFAVLQVVKYTGHTQSKKKKKNRKECCLPRYNQIFTLILNYLSH